MSETLVMRALSVLSLALAGIVAWSLLAAGAGQDWRQALAKAAFALVLLALARLAWRRPLGRSERLRRRVLRLLAVLARPELQSEWRESTPSTDLVDALLADWRAAVRVPPADLDAAFGPESGARVRALAEDIETLAADLPSGPGGAGHPAWARITERARVTQEVVAAAVRNGA